MKNRIQLYWTTSIQRISHVWRLRESDMVQNTGVYMAVDGMLRYTFVKAASPAKWSR